MLEQFIISLQIILIDIVMAADNAVVIGLVASNFAPESRKKIIAIGVAAAFIFRIIFAVSSLQLLAIPWVKVFGGVLLIWVIKNLRYDLFEAKKIRSPSLKSNENKTFMSGVWTVLVADTILSLDNVLGVAGAAKDNQTLLILGLTLSVILIGTLASYFAKYIKEHKWLGYLGIITILIVALQLIIGGLINLEVLSINKKFEFLFSI